MASIEDKLFWVWLSNIKWFGPVTISNLIEVYKKPEIIFNNKDKIVKETSILNVKQKSELLNSKDVRKAQLIINNCRNNGISIISMDEYPAKLKKSAKLTPILYYKGNLCSELSGVALTGSMRPDEYSKKVVTELINYIVERKVNVLSGFKKGIEAYAVGQCIKKGGFPIVLPGSGLDICYPSEQNKLYEKVKESGLAISQFPPGTKPFSFNVYKSKVLTCILCDKLVVIDGSAISDPISTANIAVALKKEVFSVPNNIFCYDSKGTNELIQKGASIYLSPEQLKLKIEFEKKEEKEIEDVNTLGTVENQIINYLKIQSRSIDEISCKFNLSTEKIMEIISLLELDNLLEQETCGKWTVANLFS